MKIYNLETIISVKIFDKEVSKSYYYVPAKSYFFGKIKIAERIERKYDYKQFKIEDFKTHLDGNTNMFIDNNIVYYKPYVRIHFVDGSTKQREFNTYKEALDWGQDIAKRGIKIQYKD